MAEIKLGKFTVSGVSAWRPRKHPKKPALLLDLSVTGGDGAARKVTLSLPAAFRPGEPFIADSAQLLETGATGKLTDFEDGQEGKRWDSKPPGGAVKDKTWQITLTRGAAAQPGKAWRLPIFVRIESIEGKKEVSIDVAVGDEKPKALVVPIPAAEEAPKWEAELFTEPTNSVGLKYGQKVTLKWRLKGLSESAVLSGSFAVEEDYKLPNVEEGKEPEWVSVYATSAGSTYRLEAKVPRKLVHGVGEGDVVFVRTVVVGVREDQYGGTLRVHPTRVFPGGPVSVYWSCFQSRYYTFEHIEGTDLKSRGFPLPDAGVRDTSKKVHTLDEEKSPFSLAFGPTGEWHVRASCTSQDHKSTKEVNNVRVTVARAEPFDARDEHCQLAWTEKDFARVKGNLGKGGGPSATTPGSAAAMAAAEFEVSRNESASGDGGAAEKNVVVKRHSWVAAATAAGLELYVHDGQRGYRVDPARQKLGEVCAWLPGVLTGRFVGVGAAEALDAAGRAVEGRTVVIGVRLGADGVPEVVEFPMPLNDTFTPRDPPTKLPKEKFPRMQGAARVRVLALGPRVFLLGGGGAASYLRTDANPVPVAAPKFEMIAGPAWEVVAIPGDAPGAGALFALQRASATLLRFDVAATGEVSGPWLGTSPDKPVKLLHDVQIAQRKRGDATLMQKVKQRLVKVDDGRGTTSVVGPHAALLALGPALLVRGDTVDRKRGNNVLDRAYDPALNVWVRCGHPFPKVASADAVFASNGGNLFCRTHADGQLALVQAVKRSCLGFFDVPIDSLAKLPPAGLRGRVLRAGERLNPGDYLESQNGLYRLMYEPGGDLMLTGPDGKMWWAGTKGPAHHVEVHKDGNLAVHSGTDDKEEWGAHKLGGFYNLVKYESADLRLELDDDGKLVTRAGGDELWHAPRVLGDRLLKGQFMVPGDRLVSGTAVFEYGPRGNVTLKVGKDLKWQTATETGGGFRVRVSEQGQFIVHNTWVAAETATASFTSAGRGGPRGWSRGGDLVLQSNGRLEVRAPGEATFELWHPPAGVPRPGNRADKLYRGEFMVPGDKLVEGKARLEYQPDGNLVACDGTGAVVWNSATSGQSAWRAYVEDDGNLAVYDADEKKVASTVAYGGPMGKTGGGEPVLYSSGALKIFMPDSSSGQECWSTGNKTGSTLAVNKTLSPGNYLESTDGSHRLVMQPDGELVLYAGREVKWRSNQPNRRAGAGLFLNDDGLLYCDGWNPSLSECGGVLSGGPYKGQCKELVVDQTGFHVVSKGGTKWYSNGENGNWNSPCGKVKQVNSERCRIKCVNPGAEGYLYPVGTGYRVYVQRQGIPENSVWIKAEIDAGRYAFFFFRTGMNPFSGCLMAGTDEYKDQRYKVELAASSNDTDRLFTLESIIVADVGLATAIRSVKRDRCIYPTDYHWDKSDSFNVLWWGAGDLHGTPARDVGQFPWRFESV